ncbi:hypothetical protein [Phycicoccus sp. Soil748]|uniref:hypothetical protein n=1 Tax=Phycicoccus sp. Soil748 TaxID=1736397 RepID=UPI000702D512|nr:hypothetical protein [Phycicoccus sp. Soil748]KRE53872.1 hypothetical protein ASG70_12380 [Phycicoccus sp. Soil748]
MKLNSAVHHSASSRPASIRLAARPVGRAALSCGLAGALSLGAAGAALASGPDAASRGASHGAEHQGHASGQKSAKKARPERTDKRQPGAGKDRTASQTQGTAKREGAKKSTGSQHAAAAHRPKGSTAATPAPRRSKDPRGNNGTIKIDGAAWDARVDNEPHTSCAFRVTFFGFDEGQTADITVTGHAPTGGGVLLHETAVPTSDDRATGAAHDYDGATRVITADDLGLGAVTPHPKQGYHLKVTVDSLEAPGGAKQKVLWLAPCGAQPPVTQPETQPETGGFEDSGQPPHGALPGQQPEVPAPAQPSSVSVGAEGAFLQAPMSSAYPAPGQASPASVSAAGQASALPSRLAFTGAAGVELLVLTGAAAAAAGAGLLVARRRVRATAG